MINAIFSEDLKPLVHLKYCIKESLRLFPPVSVTGRVLAAPTRVGDYLMPEGTAVESWGIIYPPFINTS